MRFDPAIFGLSHIPEKSGLPSGVRGIEDFAGPWAETTATNTIESKSTSRFIADLAVSLIPIYFSNARGAPPHAPLTLSSSLRELLAAGALRAPHPAHPALSAPPAFLRLRLQSFHRREHTPAIRERHRVAGSVERPVLRAKALDDDLIAGLHRRAADAAPLQHAGRAAGEAPVRYGAVRILDVHVEPDVRIAPLDARHGA